MNDRDDTSIDRDDPSGESRREFIKRGLAVASILAIGPHILLASPPGDCAPTTTDLYGLGPFFKANAPFREVIAATDEPGTRLYLNGYVYANDCITPLNDIVIDVWHADDSGAYSSLSDPNDYRLRAKLRTNTIGAFGFESIVPGHYLNGSQYRPSHVHIKVMKPDGKELITQLYFADDPYLTIDLGSSDPNAVNRIIPLIQGEGGPEAGLYGWIDIILDVPPTTSGTEYDPREVRSNLLRQNHPNPVTTTTTIPFSVERRCRVELALFDIVGRRVRTIVDGMQSEGAHAVEFDGLDDRGRRLVPGVYTYRMQVGSFTQSRKMIVE